MYAVLAALVLSVPPAIKGKSRGFCYFQFEAVSLLSGRHQQGDGCMFDSILRDSRI